DREVLDSALRLRAPERIRGDLHLAERVLLRPVAGHFSCSSFKRRVAAPLVVCCYFGGCEGRTSMRLGSVRSGVASRSITICAMSSGWTFQLSSAALRVSGCENSVATLPGMM